MKLTLLLLFFCWPGNPFPNDAFATDRDLTSRSHLSCYIPRGGGQALEDIDVDNKPMNEQVSDSKVDTTTKKGSALTKPFTASLLLIKNSVHNIHQIFFGSDDFFLTSFVQEVVGIMKRTPGKKRKMKTVNDVVIRRYESRDLLPVQELFGEGMKASNVSDAAIRWNVEADLSSIEKTYFAGRGTFLVMERLSDRKIVGIVGLQDLSTKESNNNKEDRDGNNFCELRRMSIHSSEQRKGRGSQLFQSFLTHARSHGFDGIKLSTGAWMHHAISFYSSVGFQDMGRSEFNFDGKTYGVANFEYAFS